MVPPPITDFRESTIDALERQEQDRKNRLHNIANVSARVPIGFGPGAAAQGGPPLSSLPGSASQSYTYHRYYPPPSPLSASLYSRNDRFMATPPPISSITRRTRYRRTNTPHSGVSGNSSGYSGGSISHSRNAAFVDSTRNSAFSAVGGGRASVDVGSVRSRVTNNSSVNNESFGGASSSFPGVSSPSFHSPMVGDGGRSLWHVNHSRLVDDEGSLTTPTNATTTMTTPPPVIHAPHSTRRVVARDRSEARSYEQRRSRRRGWEEVNEP
eukprot:CAMPEP_0171334608 /NCGR_PEP_ID=MMETSP0878-20121228/4771_1 /TAXON_ID=67004 /ORGANISM="Thalassiosira weissflogii, Strain CCMP1336" /LENGTH=268 /DNA_ID=CAMNT_0011835729 /DNA_START=216 /DNA_END=1023 /DNA_ORIENTATION=-